VDDAWKASPFRPGAVPFEVRNEASIVSFYDEANRRALKKTPLARHGPDVSPRVIAALARKKLLAEFVVLRGVTFLGFVAVGPPPTAAELAGRDWKPPRTANLSLPSGRLRVETAGSFSLGPELAEDAGLVIVVPPGEYTLTLVEVADPSGGEPPGALLTLTPADGSAPPAGYALTTRPAGPPPPPLAKRAAYTIEGGVFRGLISSDGTTNFDARAADALGLRFGSPLRVTVASTEADVYFLGSHSVEQLRQLGDPRLPAGDVLVTGWRVWADLGPEPVLSFTRWSGGLPEWGPDPRGRWRPVTITRSPLPPLTLGPLDPGAWSADGGSVRGRVLTRSPTVLTLNVGRDALAAIGARPPEPTAPTELLLTVGDKTRRLTVFQDPGVFGSKRFGLSCENGDNALCSYLSLKRQTGLGDDPDAFIAAVDESLIRAFNPGPLLGRIRELGPARALEPRPFPRPLALFGAPVPHWSMPDREVLWVEAAAYARDEKWHSILDKNPAPHEMVAGPGREVRLAKA
jgi:hypothetical protein